MVSLLDDHIDLVLLCNQTLFQSSHRQRPKPREKAEEILLVRILYRKQLYPSPSRSGTINSPYLCHLARTETSPKLLYKNPRKLSKHPQHLKASTKSSLHLQTPQTPSYQNSYFHF